jgi:hypothetical protein
VTGFAYVLSIAVLGSMIYLPSLTNLPAQLPTESQVPNNQLNQPPSAGDSMKVYESNDFGIKLLYPSDWQVEEFEDEISEILFLPQGEDILDADAVVWISKPENEEKNTATLIAEGMNFARRLSDNVSQVQEITVAGVPGYMYGYSIDGDLTINIFAQRMGNEQVLIFKYIGNEENVENFRNMLNSFEFIFPIP